MPSSILQAFARKFKPQRQSPRKTLGNTTLDNAATPATLTGLKDMIEDLNTAGSVYLAIVGEMTARILELQTGIVSNKGQCSKIIAKISWRAGQIFVPEFDIETDQSRNNCLEFTQLLVLIYPVLIKFTNRRSGSLKESKEQLGEYLQRLDSSERSVAVDERGLLDQMLAMLDRPYYHPPITPPDALVTPVSSTVFTGRDDILSRLTTFFSVPSIVFTGRDDILSRLTTFFSPRLSPRTQRTFILHGGLGAGKTEGGLEFCRQHSDWFHVVWFIDASSAEALRYHYQAIGTALGITNCTVLNIRPRLENETKEWLLFFDNVSDPSALDHYIPSCTHGNILITSRHSEIQKYAPDSAAYHVGAMEPADATSLLVKASNPTTENNEAVQLVQELQHYPLSIIHAASVIRSSPKPTAALSNYLNTYETTRADVEPIASAQKETCPASVYITLDVILRTLSPAAIDLINLVPFLHNENIPHTLFQNAFIGISRYDRIPDGWDDAVQLLSAFKGSNGKWDDSLLQQVLDQLCSFSLLKPNINMYSIPPFIHTWLNDRLTNHDRQRYRRVAGHILGLAIANDFESQELSFRQSFLAHIKHWMFSDLSDFDARLGLPFLEALSERGWSDEIVDMIQKIVDVQKRELGDWNEETLEGLYHLAEVLRHMHQYIKSAEIWNGVLEAQKKVLGPDHRLVFRTMNRLALCLYHLGRTNEAEKACLETLERQRPLFGECDRDTLDTLHTLALCFAEQRRTVEAAERLHKNLNLRTELYGEKHPTTMRTVAALALIHVYDGQWKEAQELGEIVVDIRGKSCGEDHPWYLAGVQSLASTYRSQCQYAKSEELLKNGIILAENSRLIGARHPDVLSARYALSLVYHNQARYEEAEALQLELLQVQKETLGEHHPDSLETMHELVSTFSCRWAFAEATEMGQKVVKLHEQLFGSDHRWTLLAIVQLASVYSLGGEETKAEDLLVQVLGRQRKLLGETHWDTVRTIHELANVYANQDRLPEAENLHVELLAKQKEILGPEHEDVLVTMAGLADTYQRGERIAESEALSREVLERRRKTLGTDHPETLEALFDLGYLLSKEGDRLSEAEEVYRVCLEKRKEVLVEDHPETLRTMGNLACVYKDQKRYFEAQQLEEQVYERRKQTSGTMNKDTIQTALNLIETYKLQKRLPEATNLGVETLGMLRASYGDDHVETLEVMATLGNVYHEQSRFVEGAKIEEQVVEGRRRKLGEHNKQTVTAKHNLACTYFSMGRWDEAEQLQWEVLIAERSMRGEEHEETLQNMLNLSYTYDAQGREDEARDLQQMVKDIRARSNGSESDDD